MPAVQRSASRWPAVVVTLALVGAIAYLIFFRGGPKEAPAATVNPSAETPKIVVETPGDTTRKKTEPKLGAEPVAPCTESLKAFREFCAAGKWRDARGEAAKLFTTDLTDADRMEIADKGWEIHQKIAAAFDPQEFETHEVQSGDSLTKIANTHKSLHGNYGPIMIFSDLNNPNANLRLGRKLKITKGAWSIVIDKSLFKLFLCYEGLPVRMYSVAIGADAKTPAATFKVGNRNPKPSWYPPHEMIADLKKEGVPIPVPYGHAKNPLGEFWIALDSDDYTGLGIHGTNKPETLGTKASNGCIRMDNKDVMWIAWSTHPGMVVTIVE